LSDDFHAELFATEPEVMSPADMVFDENGKIYVAEMLDYPADPPPGQPARSRIRLLETDAAGKIVRTTGFADNVRAVSGIMPWKGGLIADEAVAEIVEGRADAPRNESRAGARHGFPVRSDQLLAQQNRFPALLKAIENGQVEPAALDGGARSRLYENLDPAIAEKSHALLESTNSDRAKVVASYHDVVDMQGDVGHGKKLFEENCARCHMPRRQGGAGWSELVRHQQQDEGGTANLLPESELCN
jgi:mono/diheme cytochrome c family protein